MPAFRSPVDIGNRALQHCGQTRMDPILGFNEVSKAASEVSFCYDKLREAELQRRTWTFSTRRQVIRPIDTTTMLLSPSLWSQGTTFFVGSIVADEDGDLWISRLPNNLGNDPENTPTAWEPYFGPLTVSLYDSTTAYYTGEIVYTTPGDGTSRIYLSRIDGNADVPGTASAYDATVTYLKNQVVTLSSVAYMSLIDLNANNTPSAAPALFNIATTYAAAAQVGGSDGLIYTSVGSGNVGHDPTTDNGAHWTSTGVLNPWTTVFVGGTGSVNWLEIGGAEFPSGVGIATPNIVYPLGAGPASQATSKNVYRLPSGFLRLVSQNPKPGIGALGGPTGVAYDDWLIEGDYLIACNVGPIPLRFIANVTDVSRMHAMFCEGLAARIGLEVCDVLTQSNAQAAMIEKIYDRWIMEAGEVDAIEDGYVDPPDDDLITVRL